MTQELKIRTHWIEEPIDLIQFPQIQPYLKGLNRIVTEMQSPDLGASIGSAINSSDGNATGVRFAYPRGPAHIESTRPLLGVMDLEPTPFPELLKNEEAEDEHDRGMSFPFMNEDEDEDEEYGLDGFR